MTETITYDRQKVTYDFITLEQKYNEILAICNKDI